VSDVARAQRAMRFRGRSYMAFVLTPELPIADWLIELDEWIRSSAGYFVGRPVVLDLSGVTLSSDRIAHLISELSARDVRVMGLEGTQAEIAPGLPPANVQAYALMAPSGSLPVPAKDTACPALIVTLAAGEVMVAVGA